MDLKTRYMGLELGHPIVASASPLSESLDGIRKLEDSGAAAIVMFSLFEEQIRMTGSAEMGKPGPDEYLRLVENASGALDIPLIASLNCVTAEGWSHMAASLEQAGASGIELNIFGIETDLGIPGEQVEQRYIDSLRQVRSAVSIPVAMKLNPFFSAIGHMARRLDEAGADALVLFNRFYRPDINIDSLKVLPALNLSHAGEIRLPLQWIALLHGRIRPSLGATGGVETADEVIKYLLAGADIVMTTSALLRRGPGYLATLLAGLEAWMEKNEFESISQVRGMLSHARVDDPLPFERSNYIRVLESYR